ncbi:hypothetical protein Tco_0904432 [Tanacetum coccineum]
MPCLSPNVMLLVSYDIDAILGIHHWEKMKRLAYRGKRAVTSVGKVYSDLKIMFVDEVIVDDLTTEYYLVQSLLVYMRSLIIRKRAEDVQLGVESYQKSLNIIRPQKSILKIEHYLAYTTCLTPFGVVYEGRDETKKFMGGDEVSKFYDGILIDVKDQLKSMLMLNQVGHKYECLYNREWSTKDVQRSTSMVRRIEAVLKERRKMQRLEAYVGRRPMNEDIRIFVRPE